MPASRPRKAKPVEMRRTERLWTAFDHSQATMATAMATTRTCQNRPATRGSLSESRQDRLGARAGVRFGVDVVTAQGSQ
ncbi:hypothetical protein [Bradyrhizobium sp. JR3.5]